MIFLFLRSGSTRICCRIPIQSANHSDEPLKANIMSSNELESDSISGWNLTQTSKNRLDSGAYGTHSKGFTFSFNNTVLRGAGLNGCAIFVRKLWIWLFEDDMFLPVNLGIRLFEDDVFSTFWGLPVCMFSVFWEEGGEFGRKGRATRQKRRDSDSFEAM